MGKVKGNVRLSSQIEVCLGRGGREPGCSLMGVRAEIQWFTEIQPFLGFILLCKCLEKQFLSEMHLVLPFCAGGKKSFLM